MKPSVFIFILFAILLELSAYIELKLFLKKHRNESVEQNYNGLKTRYIFMLLIPVILLVSSLCLFAADV